MERVKLTRVLDLPETSSDEQILTKLKEVIKKGTDAFDNWTLEDFIENDPEALLKMASDNQEQFEKINAQYFKNLGLQKGYTDATKRQLQNAKKALMQQSQEERDEFKENYPEEYKLIMSS